MKFIGDYKVNEEQIIGQGTFAKVYEAEHTKTKHKSAVKDSVIKMNGVINVELAKMAKRELEILRKPREHKNIVNFYDHYVNQDHWWIFLELCDLKDLKAYLEKNPELDMKACLKIMCDTTSGLAFMHNQTPQIVHRDINLKNILLKTEGTEIVAKLADFGSSKIFGERDV